MFCCLIFCTNFYSFLSQLVALGPDDLGDWEKPKPEPKKKTKTKKTAEEKGDEDEEEDEEEEEEEEDRTKEVYEPRLTRHPQRYNLKWSCGFGTCWCLEQTQAYHHP